MRWKNRQIILICIAAAFILSSCDRTKSGPEDSDTYSIKIGEFPDINSAKDFRIKLNRNIADSSRIEKFSDELYKVLLGKYKSSFGAAKNAYRLNSNGLIHTYSIMKGRHETLDEFRNVLFVARYLGRPSVFSVDIFSKQTELIWSSQNERVISMNTSGDRSIAFVTTATSYGVRSNLPYVHGVSVYQLQREASVMNKLKDIGDCAQLYTYWENSDTFKVNVTSIDTIDSRKIYQNVFPFDLSGKLNKVSERKFNLVTDGFPLPPNREPEYISPNNRFQFRTIATDSEYDCYIKDVQERSDVLVASSKRKVLDARWSDDGDYLFIITENSVLPGSPKKTQPSGELIVINAVQKKLIADFNSFRYGNMLVQGNFLIFDERLNDLSRINIFDFVRNKIYYTLVIPGGCGLVNLPM
ncbi:MAG: hypothetical protein AB1775_08665 [Bacteroidota bacterium]